MWPEIISWKKAKVRSKKVGAEIFLKNLLMKNKISGSHIAVVTTVPHCAHAVKYPENGNMIAPNNEAGFESEELVKNKYIKIDDKISGAITCIAHAVLNGNIKNKIFRI